MATNEKAAVPALRAGRRRLTYAGAAALALLIGACAKSPNIAVFEASGETKPRAEAPLASSPDTLVRLADAARAMGNRDGAAGFYHRAARAAPNDPELQVRLGFTLRELGALLEAEAAFRRAIAADLGNADALRGLGITLIARDMPHHAIEYLEAAVAARPDPRAYNAMGVALDMVGERASAREAYGAGLAEDPENLSLLNNLGLSLTLSRRYAEAIAVLGRAADNPNATPRHRQNLALAYGLAGRPDKAAEVANTDLDMRSVRNNLGYYAWLRRQPGEQTEQALEANLDAAPPIQLADADLAPAPEFAPEPPLAQGAAQGVAQGAAPMFDGALLEGGPVVLTPRSQTGSLYRDSGAAGTATESPAPALREPVSQDPVPQDNVIWELQSVESDDPAARDADGKDADTSGEKKPELKDDSPSAGQDDQTVGGDGGEPTESVVELAENREIIADSSKPATEHADLARALPATAPTEVSPTTVSPSTDVEVWRQAATEIAPPATQTAALSPDDAAQEAPTDESAHSTAPASDVSADDMAIELPASRDYGAMPGAVAEFDSNFAALVTQAESATPRQAASPNSANAGDREEHTIAPAPDALADDAQTGKPGTDEAPASGPEPAMLADNRGLEASSTGAAAHPGAELPAGPTTAAAAGRPPMARPTEEIDVASKAHQHTTIVAARPPPSEPASEPVIATPGDAPSAVADTSTNGPGAAEPNEPVGAGPPVARTAVNAAEPPEGPAAVSVTPLEASEYTGLETETAGNASPETVLALASPPGDPAPGPRTSFPYPADTQPAGPQTMAVPQLGAKSADWPPGSQAGRQAGPPRLLRSGMSQGLGPPLSAPRGGHDAPRQLASAEAAAAGIGRALIGSLTPADPDAAAPTTAMVALGAVPSSGIPAPAYGLAALILAGLLSLLWMRRRRQGNADGGARAETGSEADL